MKVRRTYNFYADDPAWYYIFDFFVRLGTDVVCYYIARGQRLTFATSYHGVKYTINLTQYDIEHNLYEVSIKWMQENLGKRLHSDYTYWSIA